MGIHFRGLEVPPLGSTRDKIYRQYLMHEIRVEAKKRELELLITMATPSFSDANAKRAWDVQAKKAFNQYVLLMTGSEYNEKDNDEKAMLDYYENVIKTSKPVLKQIGKGQLGVIGLPDFKGLSFKTNT